MPHHANRPTKTCATCGRPFQWRRKWKDVWEEVRYCSDRCRNQAKRPEQRRQGTSIDNDQADHHFCTASLVPVGEVAIVGWYTVV